MIGILGGLLVTNCFHSNVNSYKNKFHYLITYTCIFFASLILHYSNVFFVSLNSVMHSSPIESGRIESTSKFDGHGWVWEQYI